MALVLGALTGCGIRDCKDPAEEDFMLDVSFDERELAALMEEWSVEARGDVTCDVACRYFYDRERGWSVASFERCELTVQDETAADPAAAAGRVRCAGRGSEYGCE